MLQLLAVQVVRIMGLCIDFKFENRPDVHVNMTYSSFNNEIRECLPDRMEFITCEGEQVGEDAVALWEACISWCKAERLYVGGVEIKPYEAHFF